MGNVATPEALVLRWGEVSRDPSLQDLPYKIELNAWGKVEMTPASNRHSRLQGELAAELRRSLGPTILIECSLLTRIGIRVPDVAWASPEFMAAFGEITPYVRAPEICVAIVSPSNVQAEIEEKTAAYLAAGAREVWIVLHDGHIRCFSSRGELDRSAFNVVISLPSPIS